jgi:Mn-dependent DtxR family transcriptional regulator
MTPNLGSMPIDLDRLLESRMLIQANSGGGKSYALRRVLEQTALGVQQLIIDPEGEFATLRDKFEYVICAPTGGDALATPATAAALARALWESRVSAVIDIYELRAHDRITFVRRFLEALVNAPKRVWNPALVVVDEAHIFAPQTGQAESLGAMIDLASRGRKRGLSLLAATQRLSKLHKDVAAELLNKLIGRVGLDVDLARAAEELGMSRADARAVLPHLDPGTFFAYGPALSRTVQRTKIGTVSTRHPEVGSRAAIAPPPASPALLKKLAGLQGIQKAAVDEANELETLRQEVKRLMLVGSAATTRGLLDEISVQKRVEAAVASAVATERRISAGVLEEVYRLCQVTKTAAVDALQLCGDRIAQKPQEAPKTKPGPDIGRAPDRAAAPRSAPEARQERTNGSAHIELPSGGRLMSSSQQRILDSIAALNSFGVDAPAKHLVAAHAGVSPRSSGYTNNLGSMRSAGLIAYPAPGLVELTEEGRASARHAKTPPTLGDLHDAWFRIVTAPQARLLAELVEWHPTTVAKDELARRIEVSPKSSGYTNNLGALRSLGLLDYPSPGMVSATDLLFPKGFDGKARP